MLGTLTHHRSQEPQHSSPILTASRSLSHPHPSGAAREFSLLVWDECRCNPLSTTSVLRPIFLFCLSQPACFSFSHPKTMHYIKNHHWMNAVSWLSCCSYIKCCFIHSYIHKAELFAKQPCSSGSTPTNTHLGITSHKAAVGQLLLKQQRARGEPAPPHLQVSTPPV